MTRTRIVTLAALLLAALLLARPAAAVAAATASPPLPRRFTTNCKPNSMRRWRI